MTISVSAEPVLNILPAHKKQTMSGKQLRSVRHFGLDYSQQPTLMPGFGAGE